MLTLLQELKKNNLFQQYWTENNEIFHHPIVLEYEPVGEMGIYSKTFSFELPYHGDCVYFFDTIATIEIKISSLSPIYNIESAVTGGEPYHNIKISIKKNNNYILSCMYRLWDESEAEYCGKETALKKYFMEKMSV